MPGLMEHVTMIDLRRPIIAPNLCPSNSLQLSQPRLYTHPLPPNPCHPRTWPIAPPSRPPPPRTGPGHTSQANYRPSRNIYNAQSNDPNAAIVSLVIEIQGISQDAVRKNKCLISAEGFRNCFREWANSG
jgi:hypothetical protein